MSHGRPLAYLFVAAAAAGCVGSPATSLRPLGSLPTPPAAGAQNLWMTDPSTETMSSRWYLDLAGEPVIVSLTSDLAAVQITGSAVGSNDETDVVDNVDWDTTTGVLDFRRLVGGVAQWAHLRSVEGVVTGRLGYSAIGDAPPTALDAYDGHVIGWNGTYFSQDIVPRVFDVEVGGSLARLRLDRDAGGALVGRFKVYADEENGNADEEVEYDVAVQTWDGANLAFTRTAPSFTQTFTATVDGNSLVGTMTDDTGDAPADVVGTRVELLAYGLEPRDTATRADWQTRTRRQLAHLMMADNPAPLSFSVDREPAALDFDGVAVAPDRDDDANDWDADYTIDELKLMATIANPYGGEALARVAHGYLTTPAGDAPAAGWPAVVVLNGHQGSAQGTLDPYDSLYWYGDAWARRGYVVIAIDIGHRPYADRATIYTDYTNGDQPLEGNGTHPAIRDAAIDSDWAEDGERVWDVERAVDYLTSLGTVDVTRIAMTGLSMGSEVTSFAAALDGRIAAVIPAGFVPDLEVMALNGNHPCWRWLNGDPRDYFSVSDLHALIAPRPLVAETGLTDATFSRFMPPFVDGKEVTRRSRAAYNDAPAAFALYLHPGAHEYRFGDVTVANGDPPLYVAVPNVDGPRAAGDLTWAADGTTVSLGMTLADVLANYLPPAPQ